MPAEMSDRASAPSVTQGPLRSRPLAGGCFLLVLAFFRPAVPKFQCLALRLSVRVPSVLLFIYQMLIFFFLKPTLFSFSSNTFVQGGNVNHKPYDGKPVIFLMLVKNKIPVY